jgi:8-oxo-dGTP pyrophosphatase MutT (NUDIX family)
VLVVKCVALAFILIAAHYRVGYRAAMAAVRIAPRAIIRRGDLYLVVRYIDGLGDWFVFPGGGQAHGEDLQQALQREVEEEIGVKPLIRDLRFVRECIASRNNGTNLPRDFHQIEIFFECTIDSDPAVGRVPDPNQTGFEWRTISDLRRQRFFPQLILDFLDKSDAKYLGAC